MSVRPDHEGKSEGGPRGMRMRAGRTREWLNAAEIAELGLEGLPKTARGMAKFAAAQGWDHADGLYRERKGKGGGREYHVRLLPSAAQAALKARDLQIVEQSLDAVLSTMPETRQETGLETGLEIGQGAKGGAALTARAASARDARLAVAAAFERFRDGLDLSDKAAAARFKTLFDAGQIDCDAWISAEIGRFSASSLQRWVKARRSGATAALAVDKGRARAGSGVIDQAEDGRLRTHVLGLIAAQPHLTAHHVAKLCRAEFGDMIAHRGRRVAMPPVRTFQFHLARLKAEHRLALTKITNPDLYRSTLAPAGRGALGHVMRPNQLWQIDASPADALCTDGRHSIYACIDIATRRVVLSVSRTPRAQAVMLLVRKAILAFGLPETIKTDNGSDFTARDTRRLFDALGVELELSDAYSPQQKGHVERVIRTFQHDCGPLLPGFIGHNVADRKAIESRLSFAERLGESDAKVFGVQLTAAQLQAHADDWAMLSYGNRPHEGLNGASPNTMALTLQHRKRLADPRALDVLLMKVAGKDGIRTVTKTGIRVADRHYMAPAVLPGTVVLVRMDPADMGRAYLFAPDGARFLGEALCPELSGVNPQALVAAAKAVAREKAEDAAASIRAEMKRIAKGPSLIERALMVDRRDAPNVVALPQREQRPQAATAQMAAAQEAAREAAMTAFEQGFEAGSTAPKNAPPMAVTEAQQRLIAEFDAAMTSRAPDAIGETAARLASAHERAEADARTLRFAGSNVTAMPETALERYRRARRLQDEIAAGADVGIEAAVWLGRYSQSPEYRGQARMHEDFGDAYLEA